MSMIPSFWGRRSNTFDPFSLDVWDPFDYCWPFNDSNFGSFSGQWLSGFPAENSSFSGAQIDWKETPTAHVFKANLPGLRREEVKVEIDGRILQIRGERNKEEEEKGDAWHHVQRSSSRFMRRFRLPENAKVDEAKASVENGVLTVTVPKEVETANIRSIEISG
ncbi:hypothetical protein Ancab_034430 [Ancistrocladus abbreviatus]